MVNYNLLGEVSDIVFGALIGGVCTVLGVAISAAVQIIIYKLNGKQLLSQALINRKIELYEKAIRYILIGCRCYTSMKLNGVEGSKQLINESDEFYCSFYYSFQMFISKETEIKYNELRNDAWDGRISAEHAYERACELLNFKIK